MCINILGVNINEFLRINNDKRKQPDVLVSNKLFYLFSLHAVIEIANNGFCTENFHDKMHLLFPQ